MPVGVPQAGGSPARGRMGGLIPRGEPGGGGVLPTGGSPVLLGAELGLQHCWQEQQLQQSLQCLFPAGSFISCGDAPAPAAPRTGPASPVGARAVGTPVGTPLPAALPSPGPPAAAASGA